MGKLVSARKSKSRRPRPRPTGDPAQIPVAPTQPTISTTPTETYDYYPGQEPDRAEIERRIRAELAAELAAERSALQAERAHLDAQRAALAHHAAVQKQALQREEKRLQHEKQAIAAKRRATRLATSDLATQRKLWQTVLAAERAELEQTRSETERLEEQAARRLQSVEIEARAIEADLAAKKRLLGELEAAIQRARNALVECLPAEPTSLAQSLEENHFISSSSADRQAERAALESTANEIAALAECVLDAEARLADERRRWDRIERNLDRDRREVNERRADLDRLQLELQGRHQRLANAELAFQRHKLQIERALDERDQALRRREARWDRAPNDWQANSLDGRAEREHLCRTIASLRAEIEHLAAALVVGGDAEPKTVLSPALSAA